MKTYLAAPFICQKEALSKASDLAASGIEVTGRWLTEDTTAEQTPAYQAERAVIDLEDINEADCFVLLAEQDSRTGGKHFETGYAYSKGKRVLVVGRHENVFHHLPDIEFAATWEDALSILG